MSDGPFNFQLEADKMLLGLKYLSEVDLDGIASAVSKADTLGPIIDPTKYKAALDRGHMHAVGRLAGDLRPVIAEYQKVVPDGL